MHLLSSSSSSDRPTKKDKEKIKGKAREGDLKDAERAREMHVDWRNEPSTKCLLTLTEYNERDDTKIILITESKAANVRETGSQPDTECN